MKSFLILFILYLSVSPAATAQEVKWRLQHELRVTSDEAFVIGVVRPSEMLNIQGVSDNQLTDLAELVISDQTRSMLQTFVYSVSIVV